MTLSEAARFLGKSRQSGHSAALRQGFRFHSNRATPKHISFSLLTDQQRLDFSVLKRAGYKRDEALLAIGRADLIEE